MTWRALVVGSALLTVAACGRGGDPSPTVIGRLSSISGGRACASPDRGATQACVDVDPDDLEGVEVGACVALDPEVDRIDVIDEADCAAGDLGD